MKLVFGFSAKINLAIRHLLNAFACCFGCKLKAEKWQVLLKTLAGSLHIGMPAILTRSEGGSKSTGLTAKSKALEIARTLQKAADEARRGALTEARTRELLSEVLQSVNGEGLRVFSVAEWFEHFVKGKGKSRSNRTAAIYEQTKCLFIEFLGHRARLNIAAVTSKDIADFRDYRHSLGLAPATVNLDIQMLSAAFNAAWKQGHISVNPCAAIEPVKDKPQRKQVFIPEQVTALVKVAKGDWKGLILTGFYCGQRLNDCANIRWRDVDLVSEIKTIRFQTQKTGAEIVTVIHPALEDHLLSLPAAKSDDAFVFPSLAQPRQSALERIRQAHGRGAH